MSVAGNYKLETVALIALLLALVYFYLKRVYSYWERKGFKSLPNVSLIFGHLRDVLAQKESIGHFCTRVYRNTNEPFLGVYGLFRPMLIVNDPELIRKILIKDFSHFVDRGVYSNEKVDPLSAHLFTLEGQKWKNIRKKLTPTFTSGKLKAMFPTLVDCGSTLQNYLENLVIKDEVLNVREIAACHSINVIASVGFGIDVDTISSPNHEFREKLRKVFAPNLWNGIRFFLRFTAPKLMCALRIRAIDKDVEDFLVSIVEKNLDQREKGNVFRKDFFQLLTQVRNDESIELDDQWESAPSIKTNNNQKALSIHEMAAQAFIFFSAGFETTSSALSYCMYELAKHPEIQERAHNEIDEVLKKHDGKITYESVSDMKYLENCFDETLRKYPGLPMLNRKCAKEYRIPGTNHIIEKGVEVFISVLGLQNNEKYYAEPDKFDPDRWNERNELNELPYLPFGDGPRICIALQLGKMQVKVALVLMLQKFKYELHESLKNCEIEFEPRHFLLQPRTNISLHVSRR